MKAFRIVLRVCKLLLWLAVVAAVVYFGLKLYDTYKREYQYPVKFEKYVETYAEEYGLDEPLVYAVIKAESDFDASARSGAGAVGLMQIMPKTYEYLCTITKEECNTEDLSKPEVSIRYGCLQLSRMKNRFGDGAEMLAAYNAGEGTVAEWLQDPALSSDGKLLEIPYEETRNYVLRVQKYKEEYIALYGAEKEWK